MRYAPIALFTYSRADHTQIAVESLLKNKEAIHSELYVFSDGPKTESKREAVEENRKYIHSIKGFKRIHIIENETNKGLSNSLIDGITRLCNEYGRVIVIEDDLIVSPYFLQYMNDGLEKYKENHKISAISAFLNPIDCETPGTFFLRYFACWGWATWKRSWDLFNPDARTLLKQIRWKIKGFNIDNSHNFYGMLYCHKVGLVDSWAVRFYATSYLANKLVLYPPYTMTLQNGIDGSGTHSGNNDAPFINMKLSKSPVILHDIAIEENKFMYKAYARFYNRNKQDNFFIFRYYQFKSFIRRLLGIDYK